MATFTPISLSCVQGVCVHYHRRKEYHLLANLGEERRQILVEAARPSVCIWDQLVRFLNHLGNVLMLMNLLFLLVSSVYVK